jgi:hypothetical protein
MLYHSVKYLAHGLSGVNDYFACAKGLPSVHSMDGRSADEHPRVVRVAAPVVPLAVAVFCGRWLRVAPAAGAAVLFDDATGVALAELRPARLEYTGGGFVLVLRRAGATPRYHGTRLLEDLARRAEAAAAADERTAADDYRDADHAALQAFERRRSAEIAAVERWARRARIWAPLAGPVVARVDAARRHPRRVTAAAVLAGVLALVAAVSLRPERKPLLGRMQQPTHLLASNGAARWSHDGRLALDWIDHIAIWDEATGARAVAAKHGRPHSSRLAWAPDDRLAFEDEVGRSLGVYDPHRDAVVTVPVVRPVVWLGWSPDGVLAARTDRGEVLVWPDGLERQETFVADEATATAWAPRGRALAYARADELGIWTGPIVHRTSWQHREPTLLAWAPDGSKLGVLHGEEVLVSAADGREPSVAMAGAHGTELAWSRDGLLLAVASWSDIVLIDPRPFPRHRPRPGDRISGALLRLPGGTCSSLASLAVFEELVVTGCRDHLVVFNLATGGSRVVDQPGVELSWSPDGRLLAAQGEWVHVWSRESFLP